MFVNSIIGLIADITIGVVAVLLVVVSIIFVIKKKKSGCTKKTSSCCNCTFCDVCEKNSKEK